MRWRTPGPAGALGRRRRAAAGGWLACVAAALSVMPACSTPEVAPAPRETAVQAAPAGQPAGEATCTTAPLKAQVLSVRHESPDRIRVDVALSNLLAPGAATEADLAAVSAAVAALQEWSVLSGAGLRRAFPLRTEGGGLVGVPAEVPPPGATRTFWAAFPLVDGPISLLLPGFPPVPGLVVPPLHGMRPEP